MAGPLDLVIEEGATFTLAFAWQVQTAPGPPPVYGFKDLTGYTAKLQIRQSRDETAPVLSERSTAAATITLGGVAGTVSARWTAAETAALVFTPDAWYDLFVTAPDGVVSKLLAGRVHLSERVTVVP